MSGFDTAKVDAAFFPDGKVRGISNFLVNLLLILFARTMATPLAKENPEPPLRYSPLCLPGRSSERAGSV